MTQISSFPENPETTTSLATIDGTRKLRDLIFTDLFISEGGQSFVRGMEDEEGNASAGALVGVPPAYIDDLEELQRKTVDRGQSAQEFFMDYDGMRFRINKIEDVDGVWFTLRRAKWPIPRLNELGGIPPRVIEYLGFLGKKEKGLIIIAGATGQGKTTTACSLLQDYLIYFGDVAVTLEDPIEMPLNGPHGQYGHCFQTQVKNGDFGAAMALTMRRSPRYILLGEVRSPSEASQAIRAAINGHLVITTIHAGGAVEAINAMLKFVSGSEPMSLAQSILADGLAGVFHQKLTKVKGRRGKILQLEYLFPGQDKGIRTLIRSGKMEQLSTHIDQQATRVFNGQLPIGD